jgi:hypothetical protein
MTNDPLGRSCLSRFHPGLPAPSPVPHGRIRMRSLGLVVLAAAAALVPAAPQGSPSDGDSEPASSDQRARPLEQRVPYEEGLTCVAEHESGGRWDIATGDGYHGGLQLRAGGRAARARGFSPRASRSRASRLATPALSPRGGRRR